jgi:hypothetical protein
MQKTITLIAVTLVPLVVSAVGESAMARRSRPSRLRRRPATKTIAAITNTSTT